MKVGAEPKSVEHVATENPRIHQREQALCPDVDVGLEVRPANGAELSLLRPIGDSVVLRHDGNNVPPQTYRDLGTVDEQGRRTDENAGANGLFGLRRCAGRACCLPSMAGGMRSGRAATR